MMKIDIWSDIRCPFCYIGKRKFEEALARFEHKDKIEVDWHSFELDPNLETKAHLNAVEHLAESKGISVQEAEHLTNHVKQAAEGTGIEFKFNDSIIANSFNAHRLIQMAKAKEMAGKAEEELFKAHFTNSKNIDDNSVLIQIGNKIGLGSKDVEEMLNSDAFSQEVRQDEARATQLGIRGVPFFVLNNKYGISGAQPVEYFLEALKQSYTEFSTKLKPLEIGDRNTNDSTCDIDGNCN